MNWIRRTFKYMPHLGCVHFQETHFKTLKAVKTAFRRLGGKILGFAPSGAYRKGVLTWVPASSPIYDIITSYSVGMDARWVLLKICTEQSLHVLNVYAPSDSKAAREAFFEKLGTLLQFLLVII